MTDGPAYSAELMPALLTAPQVRFDATMEPAWQSAVEKLGDAHLDLFAG